MAVEAEVYYGPTGWMWGVDLGDEIGVDGGACDGPADGARLVIRTFREFGIIGKDQVATDVLVPSGDRDSGYRWVLRDLQGEKCS